MKTTAITFSILAIISTSVFTSFVCSSFAVYSQDIIYGMNFDYIGIETSNGG